jgi:NTP pyrophosphatase (non-canonical NTP hydrolase)
MSKTLNELRDEAVAYAKKQGFHDGTPEGVNFAERLMLVVSELSEALEADRAGKWCPKGILGNSKNPVKALTEVNLNTVTKEFYEHHVRGTVEEEIADALIRLFDIAGIYGINLDWHVTAKKAYNDTRSYKHGKIYG